MNKGFTVQEMIVALALFAIVVTISTSAFLNLNNVLNRAESLRTANDSLDFSMGIMSQEIKRGKIYVTSNRQISFNDTNGNVIVYQVNGNGQLERTFNGGDLKVLTAPQVNIENLEFSTSNSLPLVTIILGGYVGLRDATRVSFNLQTSVSNWRTK